MAAQWQKRLLKSKAAHVILSHVAALIMRLIYVSCRVEKQLPVFLQPYENGEKNAIFVFWHGRMIMLPFLKPHGRRMVVLISQHNDGALITACMERFHIGAVRGSKKSGGSDAVRGLVEALTNGDNISITPDGPRGPFQVAASGAIYVAMRTGQSIIPIAFSASRHWRLKSWDRFMIPKPFSRICFTAGEPFTVATDMDKAQIETALVAMQAELNRVTMEADRLCGVAA